MQADRVFYMTLPQPCWRAIFSGGGREGARGRTECCHITVMSKRDGREVVYEMIPKLK